MMRIVFTSLAIISMIAPGVAFAADRNENKNNDDGCSVATLYGPYLFTGKQLVPNPYTKRATPPLRRGVHLRWRRQDVWSVQSEPGRRHLRTDCSERDVHSG